MENSRRALRQVREREGGGGEKMEEIDRGQKGVRMVMAFTLTFPTNDKYQLIPV